MSQIMEQISVIAVAIIGVAILAVLVSRNAQTPQVINAAAAGFANALRTAVSPVTGFTGGANIYGSPLTVPNLGWSNPSGAPAGYY